jgi:hypothetical protein
LTARRSHPAGEVGDLDVVFDPAGGNACGWLRAIKPGGMLIPFGAGCDLGYLSVERPSFP